MVDVTTSEAIAVRLPANDTARETASAPWKKDPRNEDRRRQRLFALCEGIARGEYRVSATELADAILRTVRRAN